MGGDQQKTHTDPPSSQVWHFLPCIHWRMKGNLQEAQCQAESEYPGRIPKWAPQSICSSQAWSLIGHFNCTHAQISRLCRHGKFMPKLRVTKTSLLAAPEAESSFLFSLHLQSCWTWGQLVSLGRVSPRHQAFSPGGACWDLQSASKRAEGPSPLAGFLIT